MQARGEHYLSNSLFLVVSSLSNSFFFPIPFFLSNYFFQNAVLRNVVLGLSEISACPNMEFLTICSDWREVEPFLGNFPLQQRRGEEKKKEKKTTGRTT